MVFHLSWTLEIVGSIPTAVTNLKSRSNVISIVRRIERLACEPRPSAVTADKAHYQIYK